jgi:hypothetical protein
VLLLGSVWTMKRRGLKNSAAPRNDCNRFV